MSWEADAQLVRGSGPGFNLAIGEPLFLREVFTPFYPRHFPADLGYPDTKPLPELQRELEVLHPDSYVVVALGAKQALHAAVHALNPGRFVDKLLHRQPCWPSYGSVAAFGGMYGPIEQSVMRPYGGAVVCNTLPNNPDGREDPHACDIWDAAYAHPTYGWSGKTPEHRVSVWSAGKMLGAPGVRVGWLVTKDNDIAMKAQRYVEQMTSGVPTVSQHHVAFTLRATAHCRESLFWAARGTLNKNALQVHRLSPWLVPDTGRPGAHGNDRGYLSNGRGMFAWLTAKDPERFAACLTAAGVLMVSGEACGGTVAQWRCSLGLSRLTTEAAIDALINQLEKP